MARKHKRPPGRPREVVATTRADEPAAPENYHDDAVEQETIVVRAADVSDYNNALVFIARFDRYQETSRTKYKLHLKRMELDTRQLAANQNTPAHNWRDLLSKQ
jgi:hypothetical protein